MTAVRQRIPEIDWLKGFAILSVLLIHAQPLVGTAVHEYLVNRAVPIFIVLFGATSELWWTRQSGPTAATLRAWLSSRFSRLMIPVWGALVVWWTVSLVFDPNTPFSLGTVAATIIGYMPWVGTGWFVTLVLQLVLLFPLLHLAVERFGSAVCLAATLVLLFWSHLHSLEIIGWMRSFLRDSSPLSGFYAFYYFWIFAPTHLFSVTAGIVLARRQLTRAQSRSEARLMEVVVWCTVLAVGFAARAYAPTPFWKSGIQGALDTPLTALLLILIAACRVWLPAARALAWCGAASWGIYLGQMLVHTSFKTLGFKGELASVPVRWAYFGALLIGAVGFVMIGEAIREIRPLDWLPRRAHHANG